MSYTHQNNSDLSVTLAKAIKEELIRELNMPEDVVHLVVNNFDLEARGLGAIVSEISEICKRVYPHWQD